MGHDTRLKSHFLKGYMPDIVLVFFSNEILSTKVVENHRDGKNRLRSTISLCRLV